MAKVLKFKDVNSDVEHRIKEFEKLRIKFKADVKKQKQRRLKPENRAKEFLNLSRSSLQTVRQILLQKNRSKSKIEENRFVLVLLQNN